MRRVSTLLLVALLTGVFATSNIPAASAWDTDQTAVAYCLDDGYAYIDVWFFNGEPDNRDDLVMDVIAVDLQSGESADLGTVVPQDDGFGRISTGWNELDDGKVRLDLVWSDGHGGVDSRRAQYSATGDCTPPPPPPTTTTTTTVPPPTTTTAPPTTTTTAPPPETTTTAPPPETTTTAPPPETTTTAPPTTTTVPELPVTGAEDLLPIALAGSLLLLFGAGILKGAEQFGRRSR